jgi:hypothetical protein
MRPRPAEPIAGNFTDCAKRRSTPGIRVIEMDMETEMVLRRWLTGGSIYRDVTTRYNKLQRLWFVALRDEEKTIASSMHRDYERAVEGAVAALPADKPRSNRRVEQRRAEIRRMSEELRNLRTGSGR